MLPLSSLLLLAASVLPAAGAAIPLAPAGDPVREYYEDGTLKAEYAVNANGEKHGLYKGFWPDGSDQVRAIYRRGKPNGPWKSWHPNGQVHEEGEYDGNGRDGEWLEWYPDGSPKLEAQYEEGVLHGTVVEWREDGTRGLVAEYREGERHGSVQVMAGGEVLSDQIWEDGELVGLWGSRLLHPRPLDALRETLAELRATVAETPEQRTLRGGAEDVDLQRRRALVRLQAYRYLAGVPWRAMELVPEFDEQARLAAELCQRAGMISPEPENPGMPDAEFAAARDATLGCNLSQGHGLVEAVDAYMHPHDPAIPWQLKARRLLLEPRYQKLGMAKAGDFSALWIHDQSGPVWQDSATFFPACGYMPLEYFRANSAWTVRLNSKHWLPVDAARTKVEVYALDERYVRDPEPLELDLMRVDKFTVVFRPRSLRLGPDYRFWVRISGVRDVDAEETHLSYLVHFVPLEAPEEDAGDPDAVPEPAGR